MVGVDITVKGTHAQPSLSIDYNIENIQLRFLGAEFTDEPEKDGITFINASVYNSGPGVAHGYTVKFVYPDTVHTYQSTDGLYQYDYGYVRDSIRWQYTEISRFGLSLSTISMIVMKHLWMILPIYILTLILTNTLHLLHSWILQPMIQLGHKILYTQRLMLTDTRTVHKLTLTPPLTTGTGELPTYQVMPLSI